MRARKTKRQSLTRLGRLWARSGYFGPTAPPGFVSQSPPRASFLAGAGFEAQLSQGAPYTVPPRIPESRAELGIGQMQGRQIKTKILGLPHINSYRVPPRIWKSEAELCKGTPRLSSAPKPAPGLDMHSSASDSAIWSGTWVRISGPGIMISQAFFAWTWKQNDFGF